MKPSTSAILAPAVDSDSFVAAVERSFGARGYTPSPTPLPSGYRLRRDEWLEVGVGWGRWEGLGLLIPSDVDAVFRIAMWMSEALGPTPLVALRRYMGLPPVMKLYVAGLPRWKDGVDDDLEVPYPVVTHRPLDLEAPEDHGLPPTALAMETYVGEVMLADKAARRDPTSGLEWRAYLSPKSRLHRG
jgi:hypothetical protein